MDVFVFTSENLANIWAGVGACTWAVSQGQAANSSIRGKARLFAVGSLGIFYCVKPKCITTPFMVTSKPRLDEVVSHIWRDKWALPFSIVPLGTPHKRISVSALASRLPSLRGGRAWSSLLNVSPITVFAASKLTREDWAVLVDELH